MDIDAIEVCNVTKTYGDVTALDRISLSVASGSSFGLLGTNGAGKTTLFKLLVGHLKPDTGTVSVADRSVATAGPAVRNHVGYLPEHAGFPPALTGREVLKFHAQLRRLPTETREDRISETLSTVGLADAADRAVAGYSNGMNRRLGLATALLSRPAVLLLDEPTAGLDPRGVAMFHRIIERLQQETTLTVVVSSHVLTEIERLCDEVGILDGGTLRTRGAIAELRRECGDTVTVHVRLADDGEREAAVDAARQYWESVTVDGRRIELMCPSSRAIEVVRAIEAAVELDGFEIREPGLETVFERTTTASADDTSKRIDTTNQVNAP